MKRVSQSITFVAVSVLMTACVNSIPTLPESAAQIEMYTSLQHRQCEPDTGLTVAEISQRLQQAQIQVYQARVGQMEECMHKSVVGRMDELPS